MFFVKLFPTTKTNLAAGSIEFSCCLFAEGYTLGRISVEILWLFVYDMRIKDAPISRVTFLGLWIKAG